MGKKEELIEKYVADLKDKCGISADMDILNAAVTACGPAIYNDDASLVSGTDKEELARVRDNFMAKKLGISDAATADAAIAACIDQYGSSNRNKYRAVFYYLLAVHTGKSIG